MFLGLATRLLGETLNTSVLTTIVSCFADAKRNRDLALIFLDFFFAQISSLGDTAMILRPSPAWSNVLSLRTVLIYRATHLCSYSYNLFCCYHNHLRLLCIFKMAIRSLVTDILYSKQLYWCFYIKISIL